MRLLPKNLPHGRTPYFWLVFLAFFFFEPLLGHVGLRDWLITVAASLVFLGLYFGIYWVKPPFTYIFVACIVALGFGFSGFAPFNQGAGVFIIYAAAFIPFVWGTARGAYIALSVLILGLGVDAMLFHAPVGFWAVAIVVSVGVGTSNIYFAEKTRADAKLRMAHEEIEHLAKVAERERIARDLHDVLGHTLSLIIVKSALAAKLLEKYTQTPGPLSKVKEEIGDIEKASREAMAEIRSTLRGYSTYKINEEIQRAKGALGSAGIHAESETAEISMSPTQESVVALIMREAVTNVVRHAHARTCCLRLGTNNGNCILEIQDDGRGGAQDEGNGLRGMRERIEALGGTLVRDTSTGTRLRFEFPLSTASNGTH
jgi:two-component system sensor histidine kinase DesK